MIKKLSLIAVSKNTRFSFFKQSQLRNNAKKYFAAIFFASTLLDC